MVGTYEYTCVADNFNINFFKMDINMNLLNKLLKMCNTLQNKCNYRKKRWAIELKHVIDDQEIRSYVFSFEINRSASFRLK